MTPPSSARRLRYLDSRAFGAQLVPLPQTEIMATSLRDVAYRDRRNELSKILLLEKGRRHSPEIILEGFRGFVERYERCGNWLGSGHIKTSRT